MKKIGVKICWTIGILMLITIIILGFTISSEYLKVATALDYNPDKMELNYEILGSGTKNVILIHGLAGSKNYWKRNLKNIEPGHKLLLIDLLGFGDSPKPNSNYSLDIQLAAIEKIINKEGFTNGKTIIVGHSLGAIISLSLFSKHPDWFEGSAVIGLPVVTNKDQFINNMAKHSNFDRLAVSSLGKLFCMLHPLYTLKWFKPENLTEDVFSDSKKHTWQSYFYSLNEIILKTNLYIKTMNIKDRKILFIHGNQDQTAPFVYVKNFAKTFTNAKLIEVKDGDHQLFLKNPQQVWNLITENF
jgi:pimeloyl-ACP methyl ester carboxylesterase